VIREALARARQEGRAALLPYLTAGLPDPEHSVDLFAAMAEAGADAFEVGIPYSDPLMDGPVIQRGSGQALAAGTTLARAFDLIKEIALRTKKPLLAMTYVNPVMRVGANEFCQRLAEAGASGLIVADLPLEESQPFREATARADLGLVQFVAPTSSDERLRAVAEADPVFIYGVADMGVTGERTGASDYARLLAERVRKVTTVPLVLGVGISTSEQAAAVRDVADGVIVGSALVRLAIDGVAPVEAATRLADKVAELRLALSRN
jgi:tryptophan synthase alpha chain